MFASSGEITVPAEYLSPFRPLAILHHPGLEPFLDQAHDASVRDAMFNELDHPRVVKIIEEAPDVGIKYLVHFPFHERVRQRIQRLDAGCAPDENHTRSRGSPPHRCC